MIPSLNERKGPVDRTYKGTNGRAGRRLGLLFEGRET